MCVTVLCLVKHKDGLPSLYIYLSIRLFTLLCIPLKTLLVNRTVGSSDSMVSKQCTVKNRN